jgi:hypothetical protein
MNSSNISLGTVTSISKHRYSKWPYWLYYNLLGKSYILFDNHSRCQEQLHKEHYYVVFENAWDTFRVPGYLNKRSKKRVGILYKFSDEMDRLAFMMKYA